MTKNARGPLRSNDAGVMLVELMVVLIVLGVGVMALTSVQTRSAVDVFSSGQHSRALALAQSRMEIARAAGFELVQPDSGQADTFAWRTAVDSIGPGLSQVRVTVNWTQARAARTMQLNTLLSAR